MLGSVAVERVFEHHGGGGEFDDLTARFDESHGLHDPVVPSTDGTAVEPYTGPDADRLSVGGALNDVAAHIATGRDMAGVPSDVSILMEDRPTGSACRASAGRGRTDGRAGAAGVPPRPEPGDPAMARRRASLASLAGLCGAGPCRMRISHQVVAREQVRHPSPSPPAHRCGRWSSRWA
jgi:hypothetical protein